MSRSCKNIQFLSYFFLEKVYLSFEGQDFTVDLMKMQISGLVKELIALSQPLKIQMPKWVTLETIQIFIQFINSGIINTTATDQSLQRLLWLGDHLQIDDLQVKTISEVILQRIDNKNCVLFLNEAFKKLKACEDSCDIWYVLLNTCMNYAAKNLFTIAQYCQKDLQKINPKIVIFIGSEEILDRAIKYHKRKNQGSPSEFLEIIFQLKNCSNVIELINQQKKTIRNKKINCKTISLIIILKVQSHPSINWKLSNLSSIVNKETQSFKFSDYNWKLVAKMEKDNVLRIYLKLENYIAGEAETQMALTSPYQFRIVSLYFLLSLNNSHEKQTELELTPQHILIEKGSTVQLCEFKNQELYQYDSQKLEFTVFLNTDQILSLAINYVFMNLQQVLGSPTEPVHQLEFDDAMIFVKASPLQQKMQEQALQYLIIFFTRTSFTLDQQNNLLECIEFSLLTTQFLNQCLQMPQTSNYLKLRLEREIQKLEINENRQKERGSCSIDQKSRDKNTQSNSSRIVEFRGRNQSDRSFLDQMQNKTNNDSDTNSSSLIQLRGQNNFVVYNLRVSNDKGTGELHVLRDMPLNKLEKLKKNSSQTRVGNKNFEDNTIIRRDSGCSQQSTTTNQDQIKQINEKQLKRRAIMDEINIINFLKTSDLYNELKDVIQPYL